MDKEAFWNAVQSPPNRLLSDNEKRTIQQLLNPAGPLALALSHAWFVSDAIKNQMVEVDYSLPGATLKLSELKGRLQGMTLLVQHLLDITEENDDAPGTTEL